MDSNNFNGQQWGGQQNPQWGWQQAPQQNTAPQFGTAPQPQPEQAAPKKGGAFGRIMMSICMGLLFGIFAGAGFYAVTLATGSGSSGSASANTDTALETVREELNETRVEFNDPEADSLSTNGENHVTVLTTEESDITQVVADVMPSMVSITEYYTVTGNYWGTPYSDDGEASGSGIIIGETDDEYIIVTNNHVIQDADSMTVTFIDGTEAPAYLKGLDASRDIGVISVLKSDLKKKTETQIKVAELGDSESLVLGQKVIAIGNALGYGQSVTTGIVSALDREVTTSDGNTNYFIQTDAAINPGNSGGALLNVAGQVIGINSNKIGGSTIEGIGYAIPISSVRDIIEDLMGRDTLIAVDEEDSGYIGIYMQEVTSEISAYYNMPVGVYVSDLIPDGGAEAAGIQVGDIITGFQGSKVTGNDSLKRLLRYYAVGEKVEVTFMRNENGEYVEHTVTVTLGEKP